MTEAKKSTLTIDRIDPDLKYRFKIWCIEQKTTMRASIAMPHKEESHWTALHAPQTQASSKLDTIWRNDISTVGAVASFLCSKPSQHLPENHTARSRNYSGDWSETRPNSPEPETSSSFPLE